MEEFVKKDFIKILKENALECRRDMKISGTDCFRVYDRNLEEIPVTVEIYGPYCRIVDFSEGGIDLDGRHAIEDIVARYLYIEHDKLIWRERHRRPDGEQHEKTDESLETLVHENGHEFKVELLKYVDTGLFMDHAITRKNIEEVSAGLDVLNLFSYTGSFSVYAAAGGAASVTSVDLSNVYTAWAADNLKRNGFLDEEKYRCVAMDAYKFILDAIKEKRRWDLVILDPPAFSNSRKTERDFDIKKDYRKMLLLIGMILKSDGRILFSENLAGFQFDKTALKAYYKIEEITDLVRRPGFIKKMSVLRVWTLEKVKEIKGETMKRIADDDSLESLTLGQTEESGKKPRREGSAMGKGRDGESDGRRREGAGRGRREDDRRREGGDRASRGRDYERRNERKRYDDNDGRFRSDRREYGRRNEGERGYESRDYRDRDRNYKDRDRSYGDGYRRDRDYRDRDYRPYGNRDRREEGEGRSYDRDRFHGRRPYENDERRERRPYYEDERRYYTGLSDRKPVRRDDSFRPYRKNDGEERGSFRDRKPFAEKPYERKQPRARKAPLPYGYDDFRKSVKDPSDEESEE